MGVRWYRQLEEKYEEETFGKERKTERRKKETQVRTLKKESGTKARQNCCKRVGEI